MSDSLSGVGGAPPAALPNLTSERWALRTANLNERAFLLDYAKSKGIPIHPIMGSHETDIGWCATSLMVYRGMEPSIGWTSPRQFKVMCDAYAAR